MMYKYNNIMFGILINLGFTLMGAYNESFTPTSGAVFQGYGYVKMGRVHIYSSIVFSW